MSKELQGLVVGILAIIVSIALDQMNKAGKNTPLVSALSLAAITILSLWCVYLVFPWLWPPRQVERIWRVSFATAIVLLAVGRFGIWVWPPPHKSDATRTNVADYPHIQFKESDQYSFQAGYVTVTVARFRNDAVTGQKLPLFAQIIYKNAAETEVANVARGTWFPTNSNHPTSTTFETGVPRDLGIVFFNDGKFFKPVMEWFRESLVGLIPRITFEEFTEKITSVEIRFLSGNEKPKVFVFDVSDYGRGKFPTLLERPK